MVCVLKGRRTLPPFSSLSAGSGVSVLARLTNQILSQTLTQDGEIKAPAAGENIHRGSGSVKGRGVPVIVFEMDYYLRMPWLCFWHPVSLDFCSFSEPGSLVIPVAFVICPRF